MVHQPVLEVCCGSLASALAAVEGGANRIELCSALSLDGLTPSIGVIRELRERFPKLLIHVLIRPREGDFVYTDTEVHVMERDIHAAVEAGASAIVSGALTADGKVDRAATARLVRASEGLPFTFHRAFDLVADKSAALKELQELGVQRILTSGGAATAEEGIPMLRSLISQAATITILPGGGVTRHNAARIIRETGATEIHGSCSSALPNGLRQTSADEVKVVLDECKKAGDALPKGETGGVLKRCITSLLLLWTVLLSAYSQYVPTAENLAARREFEGFRFGIFLHWGIYSEFAQGEWYLNSGLQQDEYAKAASCFYPVRFDAEAWVRAIKDSGAKYITFTSRHHDGFSMFHTQTGPYNIVDATPFRRDVLRELADACVREGIRMHIYYSILDWMRTDYPVGRTGLKTGRQLQPDYDSYFAFMKTQVRELLTGYPQIGALWLDGYWDHDSDSIAFDWRMPEFYRYIHELKPACLIGNNHHIAPIEGEDFQMFERDLPGENTAGLSGQEISRLPLEMCQTMNGMWGYKVADQNYKSADELIRLIARAAAKGSNLLLNIGPQPNGELPAAALERLKGIGLWMRMNGESIYGTQATEIPEQPWGVTTCKAGRTYLHVLSAEASTISLTWNGKRPKTVRALSTGRALPYSFNKRTRQLSIDLPAERDTADYVVEVL